jgi:5,10-methylenetetrahydrofolate reductase
MGGRAIACLNARDRNVLGFRRDLLTGAAYGVDEFLCVYGDKPEVGERTWELTVRSMVTELQTLSAQSASGDFGRFRAGVTTRLRPVPAWKAAADFLFVQVTFSLEELLAWREAINLAAPVYAAVMVIPSVAMARKLTVDIPEIDVPASWMDRINADPAAGVELACELAHAIEDTDAFAGVHLIPGVRYRQTAARLEGQTQR